MYVIKDSILFIIVYGSSSARVAISIFPDECTKGILSGVIVKVEGT